MLTDLNRESLPLRILNQTGGVEDRAVHADAPIIPAGRSFRRLDFGHAAKANANAAGHGGFERKMAGNVPAPSQIGQRLHHGSGAAANQVLRLLLMFQKLRDNSFEAKASVIR